MIYSNVLFTDEGDANVNKRDGMSFIVDVGDSVVSYRKVDD